MRNNVAILVAGFFLSAGVAATRAHPAWGLLWGLVVALLAQAVWTTFAVEPRFSSDRSVAFLVVTLATGILTAALPALAAPPRGRACLGAVIGGVLGAALSYGVQGQLHVYDNFQHPSLRGLLIEAAACGAVVGVLLLGGRPQRRAKPPSALLTGDCAHAYPGQPGVVMVGQSESNGLAIAALVLGCVGFGLFALIFGLIARSQIKRSGGRQTGAGMALVGVILGSIELAVLVLYFVGIAVFLSNGR